MNYRKNFHKNSYKTHKTYNFFNVLLFFLSSSFIVPTKISAQRSPKRKKRFLIAEITEQYPLFFTEKTNTPEQAPVLSISHDAPINTTSSPKNILEVSTQQTKSPTNKTAQNFSAQQTLKTAFHATTQLESLINQLVIWEQYSSRTKSHSDPHDYEANYIALSSNTLASGIKILKKELSELYKFFTQQEPLHTQKTQANDDPYVQAQNTRPKRLILRIISLTHTLEACAQKLLNYNDSDYATSLKTSASTHTNPVQNFASAVAKIQIGAHLLAENVPDTKTVQKNIRKHS